MLLSAVPMHASVILTATLTGSQEVPPNTSQGTGFGTVVLNDAMTMITANEFWSGLTGPATVSHIHLPGALGVVAPVVFPFSGVPASAAGSIPQQSFAITAAQVTQLEAGLAYMNVHTALFPGGEIRGQLFVVPEPGTWALLGGGLAGLAMLRRRKGANHEG